MVVLGWSERGERCGLGFVDDLLRLQVALKRFGWDLHLGPVPADVAELLELVGLTPSTMGQPGVPCGPRRGSGPEVRRQAELVEEVAVDEVVMAGDAAVGHLDHLDAPGLPPARRHRLVAPEAGGAVELDGDEP